MPTSTNPDFEKMRERVAYALEKRHLPLDDEIVDTIAIVAAGYLENLGSSFGLLFPAIPEKALAMRLVLYFRDGHKPYPPTKGAYRGQFRDLVESLGDDMNPPLSEKTRETLTSLALGAWDEADFRALRTFIASYIVSLFRTGLD